MLARCSRPLGQALQLDFDLVVASDGQPFACARLCAFKATLDALAVAPVPQPPGLCAGPGLRQGQAYGRARLTAAPGLQQGQADDSAWLTAAPGLQQRLAYSSAWPTAVP